MTLWTCWNVISLKSWHKKVPISRCVTMLWWWSAHLLLKHFFSPSCSTCLRRSTQIVAANARGYERRAHARTLQDEIDRKHAEMTWTTLGPPSLKKFEKYDSRGLRQICKLHGAFTFVSRSHGLFFSTVAPFSAQHSSMKCFNQLS